MTLTALLLVGGQSRRMGADKATLIVGGEPLWASRLNLLRELQPQVLWLSAGVDPRWRPPEVELIPDPPPSRGPLSGVAAALALARVRTTHLLTLAIDLPRMRPEHLRDLWAWAQPGRGVLPMADGHFEPLCALYPQAAATLGAETLASPNVSLRHFAQGLLRHGLVRLYPLSAAEKGLYFNMNTPADLATEGHLAIAQG